MHIQTQSAHSAFSVVRKKSCLVHGRCVFGGEPFALNKWMSHSREKARLFSLSPVMKCRGVIWQLHHCYCEILAPKLPVKDARKANASAESTKPAPAWGTQPSQTSPAWLFCARRLILRVLPQVTSCLHPFFPQRVDQGLVFRPSCSTVGGTWHGGDQFTPLLLQWERAPSAVEARSSSTRTPTRGAAVWLQSDVFDWMNHREKPDHFMEEKHILPARPHPPPSLKATSKTDHRDGTEEHALKQGRMGRCVLVCSRHTQSYFVARSHTVEFTPPSCSGFSPFSRPNPCGVRVRTSRWWPATGGSGAGSSARAPPWNCLFPPTSCTCSEWQISHCSGSDTS